MNFLLLLLLVDLELEGLPTAIVVLYFTDDAEHVEIQANYRRLRLQLLIASVHDPLLHIEMVVLVSHAHQERERD